MAGHPGIHVSVEYAQPHLTLLYELIDRRRAETGDLSTEFTLQLALTQT